MIHKKERSLFSLILIILFIDLLFGTALPAPIAEAGLPSRATPVPRPDPGNDKKDDVPVGAWIALQVSDTPVGAWSVVQWQNSAGGWQNVEGWQGTLDANGIRCWWVAEKDFGKETFRWVITQGQDGSILATSPSFSLPDAANDTVRVMVSP